MEYDIPIYTYPKTWYFKVAYLMRYVILYYVYI